MFNSFKVESSNVGNRLDSFLSSKFADLSRSHIKNLIEEGNVLLNNKHVKAGEKLKLGDSLSISLLFFLRFKFDYLI